jgi:hypothetical protein
VPSLCSCGSPRASRFFIFSVFVPRCSMSCIVSFSGGEFCAPTILEAGEGDIVVKAARHPLVEVDMPVRAPDASPVSRSNHSSPPLLWSTLLVQDGSSFIANDYELTRDHSRLQFITGPNAGGAGPAGFYSTAVASGH